MFHPIKRWRSMRRRSKVIAGGIGGALLIPAVAIAAALLSTTAPISGQVHNGSWSAQVTGVSLVADTSSIGNDPAGTIFLPSNSSTTLETALGNPANNQFPNDTSEHYACTSAATVPGDATNNPGFSFTDGSGAIPMDTCYLDVKVTIPAHTAVPTWLTGLSLTGLPSGWAAFYDGAGGGTSMCTSGNALAPANLASPAVVDIPLVVVAGANINAADSTAHAVSGTITLSGSRTAPSVPVTACEVVQP